MSISVILPTYNRAHLIQQAVVSVTSQLDSGDELIVIDDGSTDDTKKVVAALDGNIRYIKTANGGAGAARNRGIEESSGDFLAFVDSDNYWLPGKLAVQRAIMHTRPDVACCFTDFVTSRSDGETINGGIRFWTRADPGWLNDMTDIVDLERYVEEPIESAGKRVWCGDLYPRLMHGNFIPVWTALVRKSQLDRHDRFPVDVNTHEEWEFFGRVLKGRKAAFTDVETAHNLAHDGARLTDIDYIERLECELKILVRVWGSDEIYISDYRQRYVRAFLSRAKPLMRHYLSTGSADRARTLMDSYAEIPWYWSLLLYAPKRLIRLGRVGA